MLFRARGSQCTTRNFGVYSLVYTTVGEFCIEASELCTMSTSELIRMFKEFYIVHRYICM